jgi:hypothetical protein
VQTCERVRLGQRLRQLAKEGTAGEALTFLKARRLTSEVLDTAAALR